MGELLLPVFIILAWQEFENNQDIATGIFFIVRCHMKYHISISSSSVPSSSSFGV